MVEGYVGWHGEGKTYCATWTAVEWWLQVAERAQRDGRPAPEFWSNVEVQGARRFGSFAALLEMLEVAATERRRVLILVDEAGVWLPSRFWNRMPEGILGFLQQRRRVGGGIDLIWTAPGYEHADKMLRDITQVVHSCKRFGGTEYSHDGGKAPKLFRVSTFDPAEITKAKRKRRHGRFIPFVGQVADLYATDGVILDQAAHERHAKRPQIRDDQPEDRPLEVRIG